VRHEPKILYSLIREFMEAGNYQSALNVLFEMADGDPSLEGGWCGFKIGECYENLGHMMAARYWYGRAAEENPGISAYKAARERLEDANIAHLAHRQD
jgi:hypothetical protein